MKFEIGDILEYKIDKNKFRCMVVGSNFLNKNIINILSGDGNNIWNEDINFLSIEYVKIGHIDLSLLIGD